MHIICVSDEFFSPYLLTLKKNRRIFAARWSPSLQSDLKTKNRMKHNEETKPK